MSSFCRFLFLLLLQIISVTGYRYYRSYRYYYSYYRSYRYYRYYSYYRYYYYDSSDAGIIVGGVIGGLAGFGFLTFLIVLCCRYYLNMASQPTGRVVMASNISTLETNIDGPAVVAVDGGIVNSGYKPEHRFDHPPPPYPGPPVESMPYGATANQMGQPGEPIDSMQNDVAANQIEQSGRPVSCGQITQPRSHDDLAKTNSVP